MQINTTLPDLKTLSSTAAVGPIADVPDNGRAARARSDGMNDAKAGGAEGMAGRQRVRCRAEMEAVPDGECVGLGQTHIDRRACQRDGIHVGWSMHVEKWRAECYEQII